MFNQLTRRKELPVHASPLRIRQAGPDDAMAVGGLAALASSRAPRGDVLLAEVGDELWAALSVQDGHLVADPTRHSADAALLLAHRSAQMHRARRPRRSHGRLRLRIA